jgi:hypothetical protein
MLRGLRAIQTGPTRRAPGAKLATGGVVTAGRIIKERVK